MPDDPWADVVEIFVGRHHESVRGRVRRDLIDHQLQEFLPSAPLQILDVGAGGGNQSVPWARRGHHVTLVDSSPAMRAEAERRLRLEPAGVADRVEIRAGDATDLGSSFPAHSFDLVMCHGVIMYLDDPSAALRELVSVVRTGGVVSVLAKNRRAMAVRPGLERNWEQVLAAFVDDRETNRLGFETRGDDPDVLESLAHELGMNPTRWFGVRYFTESWGSDEEVTDADWSRLLEAEYAASVTEPYRSMCRLFHLVGVAS